MSDSDDIADLADEGGDDLFGDGDEELEDNVISERDLSEHESDREGGYGKTRDYDGGEREPAEFREKTVVTVPMYRHRIPKSKDGTVSEETPLSGSPPFCCRTESGG
jgi:RNA polymerase-associated protein LEO1